MRSEEFSESTAAACTLYQIQGEHYHCSTAFHPTSQRFLALYAALQKPGDSHNVQWLQHPFNHTEPLLKPSAYTLVPNHFFRAAQIELYLGMQGIETKLPEYTEVSLAKSHMVCSSVAQAPSDFNVQALLLNQVMAQLLPMQQCLHLHIDVEKINIFILVDGSLALANSFAFKSKEDILYFLSAALKKCALQKEDTPVSYSGFLRPKTALMNMVQEYFPDASPLLPPDSIKFDPCFAPIAKHLYFDAFILPVCGL